MSEVEITDTEYKTDEVAEIDLEINGDLVDTRGNEDADDQ